MYGYNNMGYQQVKEPAPTKANIEQFLIGYLGSNGFPVNSVQQLSESFSTSSFPNGVVPHACMGAPLALQSVPIFTIPFSSMASVEYYYCSKCGKAVYFIVK